MAAKGQPKSGGRKKGTPNKNSLTVLDQVAAQGFDVIADVVKCIRLCDDPKDRGMMGIKLAEFIYPKRKAMEVDLSAAVGLTNTAEELEEIRNKSRSLLEEARKWNTSR